MAHKTVMKGREDEQLVLLREILAELRRLNANLEKRGQAKAEEPAELLEGDAAADIEGDDEDDDSESEELEYFE